MNILIVSDLFTIGGNTTYLVNVIDLLKRNGHTVKLISFVSQTDAGATAQYQIPRHDISVPDFQFRYIPVRFFRLFFLLMFRSRIQRPDIVLSDLCLPAGAYLLCKICIPSLWNIPFLYKFHGSNTMEKQSGISLYHGVKKRAPDIASAIYLWVLRIFERWVLLTANAIFINSPYSKIILSQIGVTDHIVINPPGSEGIYSKTYRNVSRSNARAQCGLSDKKHIILVISRLEPRKGVIQLIDALDTQKAALKTFHIVLCSQFDSYFGMETLQHLGHNRLGSSVLLVHNPSLQNKALLYRSADVVLIPSRELETFGFVTLEAYASGTPVVAYDIGALGELIPSMHLVNRVGDVADVFSRIKKISSLSTKERARLELSLIAKSKQYSWKEHTDTIIRTALKFI